MVWCYMLQGTLRFHCEYFFELKDAVDCFPITSLIFEAVYPIEFLDIGHPPNVVLDIGIAVVLVMIFILRFLRLV